MKKVCFVTFTSITHLINIRVCFWKSTLCVEGTVNDFELYKTEVCNSQQPSFKVNIKPEWTIYPANKNVLQFFQLLGAYTDFQNLASFFQNFTHKSKNCTHKMQNASHLLQNEALH